MDNGLGFSIIFSVTFVLRLLRFSFFRHGRPNLISDKKPQEKQFAQYWASNFKQRFMNVAFGILKSYAEGGYVYHKTLIKAFGFVDVCVDDGDLFKLIRPELSFLIGNCCLKSVCLNQDELEIWQEDPAEWSNIVNSKLSTPFRGLYKKMEL